MKLLFANVGENPAIEIALAKQFNVKKALLIASGGCTGFALQTEFPDMQISLVDSNELQLELIKQKLTLLNEGNAERINIAFNIEQDSASTLCGKAEMEKIFRCFRTLLCELIISYDDLKQVLQNPQQYVEQMQAMLNNPYWPVLFEMIYDSRLLAVMIGKAYVDDEQKNKFSDYSHKRLSEFLLTDVSHHDYISHRFLLGHYLADSLPVFLQEIGAHKFAFEYHHCFLQQVPDLASYDLINLSNICEWMPEDVLIDFLQQLSSQLSPNTVLLFRENAEIYQRNGYKTLQQYLQNHFTIDDELSKAMQKLGLSV